jgi:hypothetical protein
MFLEMNKKKQSQLKFEFFAVRDKCVKSRTLQVLRSRVGS